MLGFPVSETSPVMASVDDVKDDLERAVNAQHTLADGVKTLVVGIEMGHSHTVVDAKMFENGIVEVCCRCGQWMPGAKHDEHWVEQVEKAMKNSALQSYQCPAAP